MKVPSAGGCNDFAFGETAGSQVQGAAACPPLNRKQLMRAMILFAALFACTPALADEPAPRGGAPIVGFDDKEMDVAIAKAKKTVDQFLKSFAAKDGMLFAVKAPIKDENGTEYFWLSDIKYEGGKFTGRIDNAPGIVKNVKMGQRWTLKKEEIADWMFLREGKIHGNFTIRPLLKAMPADEAERFQEMLAGPE